MPQDIGTLVVRISADVAELKAGVAQAQAEIKKLKDAADSTGGAGPGGQWASGFNAALGPMNSLLSGVGSFLGVAFSVYGVLRLWSSAVQGMVSLMTSAVGAVDDYRMGIVSTAGMMTAITTKESRPDLSVAYDEWKTYLDWLYRASLETDRKVAAGGKEIFETAKQMAIRGVVPNNKDQVYTIGLLTDFIKSVTQGLSERQQLIQEVRAMFEGAMRPGAQALAQFQAIDPQFREKFEAARTASIRMGDAAPIFELLRKSLEGMAFAAGDMQNTFNSLYSTATSAFQLLMIEAFGPAYDSIVKMGWAMMDVFYKSGQLTPEGQKLAKTLGAAWDEVKTVLQSYVNEVVNHPEKIREAIGKVVTFIGQATGAALELAKAVFEFSQAIKGIDVSQIAELAKVLGLAAIAASVLHQRLLLIAGPVLLGYQLGKKIMSDAEERAERPAQAEAKGQIAKSYLGPEMPSPPIDVRTGKPVGVDSMEYQEAAYAIAQKKFKDQVSSYENTLTELSKRSSTAAQQYAAQVMADARSIGSAGKMKLDAMALAMQTAKLTDTNVYGDQAPKHGVAKLNMGKEDKGAKGRTPGDAELLKKLNDAQRALEKSYADEEFKNYKALMDQKKAANQIYYQEGKMTMEQYYDTMKKDITDAWIVESNVLQGRIEGAKRAYEANLEAIDLKAQRRELTEPEVTLLKEIERVNMVKEIWKAEQEIGRLGITYSKEMLALAHQRLQAEEAIQKLSQDATWKLMDLAGPVSEMAAKLQKIEQDYWEKVNKGKIPAPGTTAPGATFGEGGVRIPTVVSGDVELAKMRAQQWEAQWGRFTREAADAISNGFTGMIDALISGSGDFKKSAYNLMKQLFNIAMKPGLEQLTEALKKGFDKMFKEIGENVGMAVMGAIALVGMMLLGGGDKKSSFSPSGVNSKVTGHEAVRGVIAGETSIPIAQIGTSLAEALVSTNGILTQIEANTRGLKGMTLDLKVTIPGLEELMSKALESYFARMGMTGS